MDQVRQRQLSRIAGYGAGAVLGLAALAALLIPLWEMNADIDEQVLLTEELVGTLHAQLQSTEELLLLAATLTDASLPVVAQLHEDLPQLRQLTDEALPLVDELRAETLPRLHVLADESIPLQRRAVEIGEESLVMQRQALGIAREMLEEIREMRRRMAALEPASLPAEAVEE